MAFPHPIPAQPGQESVWDYPRPPRLEVCVKHIQVVFNQVLIADSWRSQRVLETSHPPVYYIPLEDIQTQYLSLTERRTNCEWKGQAHYYTLTVGSQQAENSAWGYAQATPSFQGLQNHLAFYPSRMAACYVDGERVQAQPGDFYGGWITANIVGPFKGGLGTRSW